MSRQVAALERAIGVPLFDRVGRGLALTTAGEAFLAGARDLVRRANDLVTDTGRAHRGAVGVLRVGFVRSATFAALPRLVGAFRAAWPDVRVEVTAMTTLRQAAALADGLIDVGLLRPPVDAPDLALRTLSRDHLCVALPGGHPLAHRDRVPLADLADESFVLYARSSGPTPYADPATVGYRPLADDLSPWDMALAWSRHNRSPVLARLLERVAETHPQVSVSLG